MAILATSGRDWVDWTRRLAVRVPDLDIFSQGLLDRQSGGWKITPKGRDVLEFMEARPTAEPSDPLPLAELGAAGPPQAPPLGQPAGRAKRRRESRERRREARERARAKAS